MSAEPGGRAPRRSRAELRALLLETGVELLQERGLAGGAPHITLNEVFIALAERRGERVTPASVYKRIWETQADYQLDLLISAAAFYPDGEEQPTLDAARAVVRAADRSTRAGREAALREFCRIAGEVHVRVLEQSRAWQIWVGVWALTVSTPTADDDRVLGPALVAGHEKATNALRSVLDEILSGLGFRMRSPMTVDQLALAIGALAEGMALRDRFATVALTTTRPEPGAPGSAQRWTLFGVAVDALMAGFLEPDPDFAPAVPVVPEAPAARAAPAVAVVPAAPAAPAGAAPEAPEAVG
jgi:hypothetical protein